MNETLIKIAKILFADKKINVETKTEIYNYFLKNGYNKTFSDFEKDIKNIVKDQKNKNKE